VPSSSELSSQRIIVSQPIFLPVFFLDPKEGGPLIRHTLKTTHSMTQRRIPQDLKLFYTRMCEQKDV
jgi:hypothetical protein